MRPLKLTRPPIPARRRVDFVKNTDDFAVAILGLLGWSTEAIMRETGQSFSQVIYRLGRAGIARKSYRHGESDVAKYVSTSLRNNHKMHLLAMRKLHENGLDKSPAAEGANMARHQSGRAVIG